MEGDLETCSATSPNLQDELFSWDSNKPYVNISAYTSYCTYSHSLGADEHNKELLALTDTLQEDVTDRLKQITLGT